MKYNYLIDKDGNKIGFKVPEAMVYDTNGVSLSEKLKEMGGGNVMTQEEYNALSEEEKNKGVYYISDASDALTVDEVNDRVTDLSTSITQVNSNLADGKIKFRINDAGKIEYSINVEE